jgi:hypothetical protein
MAIPVREAKPMLQRFLMRKAMKSIHTPQNPVLASPSASGMSGLQAALLAQYPPGEEASPAMPGIGDHTCTESAAVPSCAVSHPGAPLATTTVASALQAAMLRPYMTTEEAAELLCVQPQTLRKAWSQRGSYGSLKPYKVKASRRLYWPTEGIRRMVEEGA